MYEPYVKNNHHHHGHGSNSMVPTDMEMGIPHALKWNPKHFSQGKARGSN